MENKIEVTGGAYDEREGIVIVRRDDMIVITGWYDGGCPLEISVSISVESFLSQLGLD
jgi:hypothetical protein